MEVLQYNDNGLFVTGVILYTPATEKICDYWSLQKKNLS